MPIRISELLSSLATPGYIERVAVHTPRHIIQAKKAVRKAFTYQTENRCFSLVEFLSTCPTNWGKTPTESIEWVKDRMMEYFPLGLYKSPEKGGI